MSQEEHVLHELKEMHKLDNACKQADCADKIVTLRDSGPTDHSHIERVVQIT